ncbi:TetR/AcrR family transcriptional regulator [Amycolatopsis pigmentata]|uniref:TetR/AcrR family transcriptional regulator n=1 Tax=Amycolatopsis pigmentata TaxID=450801 RepID=A0ABW5G2Q3_9PSEU
MTAEPETLRADARRNREQIIAAAKKMFLEFGPDVPMEDIARGAGVGVGTLYRRFPDREALIRAVARDNFEVVLAEARAVAAEEPSAWQAIVRLLTRSLDLKLSVHLAVVSPLAWAIIRNDEKTQEFRDGIMAVLDELIQAAQADGSMRDDVAAGDVALLCSMLLRPNRFGSDEKWSETVLDRALGVIVDGLRAGGTSPLPGRPVTGDDLRKR